MFLVIKNFYFTSLLCGIIIRSQSIKSNMESLGFLQANWRCHDSKSDSYNVSAPRVRSSWRSASGGSDTDRPLRENGHPRRTTPRLPPSHRQLLRCATQLHSERRTARMVPAGLPFRSGSQWRFQKEKEGNMQLVQSKLDAKGRITISPSIRKEMDIKEGDVLEITLSMGSMVIKPAIPRCIFCNGHTNNQIMGRYVCPDCVVELNNQWYSPNMIAGGLKSDFIDSV